jgi:hypothetical protein
MIDVNKITSTLAKLPDQQLQQYAQMHKSDPYIMALAMSESNRRKEMRSAGQGAQGMQEQPKVVDSEIAQMAPQQLPEDQGIGQLPAGNMNFAGGGIIAFADGGDVERYQYGGSTMEGFTPSIAQADLTAQAAQLNANEQNMAKVAALEKQAMELDYTAPELAGALRAQIAALKAPPAAPKPSPIDPNFRRQPDPRAAGANTFAESVKAVSAAPTADTTRRPAPGAGLGAAAAAAAPEKSIAQRYADMQKEMGLGPESRADIDAQRKELEASKRAEKKTALEDFEKDVAARGEAFKGREERLAKREAGLGKMKDETTGLALLEAGLAIMSTPGGLATAIGKGAQAGLKTYGAGLEKLRSAQEKMDDARDQIEEFRRNEANMTAKERRQYKNDIARTETEIKQLGLDAAKEMYGFKREDTKAVFTAGQQERLTDKEIKARQDIAAMQERGANARAGALPSEARTAMLLGTGTTDAERFATGMAKYKELTGDKQGTQMLKMFLEENGRREKAGQDPMSLEQFRRQSAAFFAPPAAVDTGRPTRP